MDLRDLGLIGNCQYGALVSRTGEVVWCCLPRFDSEPLFGNLLDPEGGGFLIGPADGSIGTQRYLENTNVLETTFESPEGAFRVIDFAPRFMQHGRSFRPTQLIRIVEPIRGTPMIRVVCAPRLGWTKGVPSVLQGSNHLRYEGFPTPVRLTTDVPLSYLNGQPVALTQRRHLVLTWGSPIEEALAPLCDRFLQETVAYWRGWVKHCDIPPVYQGEVIRSALALKLHCFEDTGAIVAAMTTSIPEAPKSGRTWDYRYCWLRDSVYVLGALRLLGQFEEREAFVHYLFNVAARSPTLDLAPLYRVDGSSDLEESILSSWAGYMGDGPVRIGNGAATHVQNDVFGEVVLCLAPIFLDERFRGDRTREALDLISRLTDKALSTVGQPDAGIWELRSQWEPQTFSSLLAVAAADRMASIAQRHLPAKEAIYRAAAADDSVKVIVLRIDSPGGSALASELIAQALEEAAQKKPIVASMGALAASGGYYIAAGAKVIYAQPDTLTGSIGVIGGKIVYGPALAGLGVNVYPFARGAKAGMFSPVARFTPEEVELITQTMRATYDRFKGRVAAGRKLDLAAVEKIAQGRVWLGSDALDRKLVDKLGGLDAALAEAKTLGGLPADAPVDAYPGPVTLRDLLSSIGQVDARTLQLSAALATVGVIDPRAEAAVRQTLDLVLAFQREHVQAAAFLPMIR